MAENRFTSSRIQQAIGGGSWIRRMFIEGARLKQELGDDKVFDFSLGNPFNEPPAEWLAALQELAADPAPHMHCYMPNAGYPFVRQALAAELSEEHGLTFHENSVLMTVGAAGALNCALRALCDPGDEVVVLAPYFVEYRYYIDNHGAVMVLVQTSDDFLPDAAAIEAAITPRTRAVIINSPNNPSGRVYPKASIDAVAAVLDNASKRHGRPVYLITDEPYAKILYDVELPSVFKAYRNTILCTSYSKDLSLAGERIGFAAIHPGCEGAQDVFDAMAFANRILGFVNAPALMQRAVARLRRPQADLPWYRERRDLIYKGLLECGYTIPTPEGAFYLFPKTPIDDDVTFVSELRKENILCVPGSGFGRPGHVRISYSVSKETITGSLPGFRAVAKRFGLV